MKNRVKFALISLFSLFGLLMFLATVDRSQAGTAVISGVPTPTPPRAANAPKANTVATPTANTTSPAANTAKPATSPAPAAGSKQMRDNFTLGQDSLSEYGAVPFSHKTHAFSQYSPDGKSVVGCVECHHTDAPKSALAKGLTTSERDVVLTFDVWKASSQKVSECRACHFQTGNEPEGKTMPVYNGKEYNNELAYHLNCNTCHDNAAKLRPELKKKPGFATGTDCKACHSGS